MKTGAQLDQRRYAAVDADASARRLRDAGDELQRRALAGPIPADHAECGSLRDPERDVVERKEGLIRPKLPEKASSEQRAFQRREPAGAVTPVHLRHVRQFDRAHHTASAKESRIRSNSQ